MLWDKIHMKNKLVGIQNRENIIQNNSIEAPQSKKIVLPIVLIGVILLSLTFISAEPAYVFKQNEDVNFSLQVYESDNSISTASTSCYITVRNPNNALLITDEAMTFGVGGYFNYNISGSLLKRLGEYPVNVRCDDGADYAFSSFTFEITPSGQEKMGSGEGLSIFISILVILTVGGFFFLMSFKFDGLAGKITMIGFSIIILVIAILYSLIILTQNVGGFVNIISGYTNFWFIIKTLLVVVIFFFAVYVFLLAFKLWKIKRGLIPNPFVKGE